MATLNDATLDPPVLAGTSVNVVINNPTNTVLDDQIDFWAWAQTGAIGSAPNTPSPCWKSGVLHIVVAPFGSKTVVIPSVANYCACWPAGGATRYLLVRARSTVGVTKYRPSTGYYASPFNCPAPLAAGH